jgi:TATA-box binding protein (TBP) (component of TFIID and TFIIIB)
MIQGRVSVFSSGKMISIGAKTIPASIEQLEHTMKILEKEKFIERTRLEPIVQNVVATTDLKSKIDLNRVASTLTNFTLEPGAGHFASGRQIYSACTFIPNPDN